MKSGKGKGRGGCRGLAKRRRGNGGGCEIGLDCRQSDRERAGEKERLDLVAGVDREESQWGGPTQTHCRHCACGVCVGVWACVRVRLSLASPPRFLAGRIQTFCRGRTRRRVLAQPDLVVLTTDTGPGTSLLSLLSARFHS